MTRWRLGTLCLLWTLTAGAPASRAQTVDATLRQLHDDGDWGEVSLADGRTREVQVQALTGDSIVVRQVVGGLQVQAAVYAMADIRGARILGVHRIPQRLAPYQPPRSVAASLALELAVPGAGYLYAGDGRQGWTLLGATALAAGAAIGTGEDGLAAWLPLAAWIKFVSMAQLRDQVRADNGAFRERAAGLSLRHGDGPRRLAAGEHGKGGVIPLMAARLRF